MIHIEEVLHGVMLVIKTYNIKSFPIDCLELIKAYGYSIKKYSDLPLKKRFACKQLSDDATVLKHTIYYNDEMPFARIRFSLLHELGHIVLRTEDETTANAFASHLLAPRLAIYYAKCKNITDIMKHFGLSEQAANYAFIDYKRWYRDFVLKGIHPIDLELYHNFYNPALDKFIWKIQKCDFCYSETVYNEEVLCYSCRLFELRRKTTIPVLQDVREKDLDIIRGNWLYVGL